MNTKNIILGTIILVTFLISGCANPTNTTQQTPLQTTPQETYQPTFSLKFSGCDNNKFYAIITPDQAYSGQATLMVLDSIQKDNVVATKITDISLNAGDNIFSMEHGQQITDNMNFKFCLGGTCETGFCALDNCLNYSDRILCNSKAECRFDGLCSRFSCSDKKTKADCATDPSRCEWFVNYQDKGNDYCRLKACTADDTEQDCNDGYNCLWTGKICITFNCRSLSNPTNCEQDPRCTWKDSEFGAGSCDAR